MKHVTHPISVRNSKPIRGELTGSDTCTTVGLTVRSHAPVLAMCRQLLAAGLNPDQALEVYRGATLALRIRSIGEAAQLTVKDDSRGTPRFVAFRPGPDERATAAGGDALVMNARILDDATATAAPILSGSDQEPESDHGEWPIRAL
jgi:hypothetical protein